MSFQLTALLSQVYTSRLLTDTKGEKFMTLAFLELDLYFVFLWQTVLFDTG